MFRCKSTPMVWIVLCTQLGAFSTHAMAPHTVGYGKPWQWLLAALVAFTAPAQADDTGLIGHFEGPCPDGWEEYKPLAGRVPVGAGDYIGTAEDGREEKLTYTVGDMGGEARHKQTEQEMPKHNHPRNIHKATENAHLQHTQGDSYWHYVNGKRYHLYCLSDTGFTGGDHPTTTCSPILR